PDRLADHGRAAGEGAARVARERPRALKPEDARRVLAPEKAPLRGIRTVRACIPHYFGYIGRDSGNDREGKWGRMNAGLMLAGLVVGLLVGLTGMGAGSLMTPILITFFGIPAGTAVGTDLVYAAVTKTFGAARHHQLKNVNRELALWMATGSVPAAFLGTSSLCNLFNANIDSWLPGVLDYTLLVVGRAGAS